MLALLGPIVLRGLTNEPEYVVVLNECSKGAQSRGFAFRNVIFLRRCQFCAQMICVGLKRNLS